MDQDYHDPPDGEASHSQSVTFSDRLLEETVPLFGSLLALPLSAERYAPLALSPQRQRQKTLETIVTLLLELAEHHPVLFILDAHIGFQGLTCLGAQ